MFGYQKIWLSLLLTALLAGCQSNPNTQCPSCGVETLPVISVTELESLSDQDILNNYPIGFSIDTTRASQQQKDRLARLEKEGLKITSSSPSARELQSLTREVIQKGNPPGYFALIGGADGRGFQYYISYELLPYGFRALPNLTTTGLENLKADELNHIYQESHYWNNIGYEESRTAPANVKGWIQQQSDRIQPYINTMIRMNALNLSYSQQHQLSQLMILEYLSEAVRGLYYSKKQATLSFYRQLAVKSLITNSAY